MGFDGFVISDWQAIDQMPGDYASDVRTSINAGLDMIMVPTNYQDFTPGADRRGRPRAGSRMTADRRRGPADPDREVRARPVRAPVRRHARSSAEIGSAAHRAVGPGGGREVAGAAEERRRLLPLARPPKVYVAGSNADDLGNQTGGWTHHLAGRLRCDAPPARRSWTGSSRWRRRDDHLLARTPRHRIDGSRRRCRGGRRDARTPRASATSATVTTCCSPPPTRRPWTRCAAR